MKNSSKNTINIKQFNFNNVKGISRNQLDQHYELYKGYVRNINKIWDILDQTPEFNDSNPTYSPLRCLRLGETYALDGVKLHELYFENLNSNYNRPFGPIVDLIIRDFYSFERWENLFKQTGLAMRGWVVLAIDHIDKRLHIYGQDEHDKGSIWMAHPLLVLDVYEHAYMIDFGIDRKKYIDIFMENIDWNIVNQRLEMFMLKHSNNNHNMSNYYCNYNYDPYMYYYDYR
ncbi:superoxide dismutase, Fe [Gottschalkia acidurici 9a]|uniref:superoxide dismutase n=1 Tax=Gottschalkia acidurici (strain ATCC 7906 / DSM 604 / BCRC 14475 / CIP 104303 / KCTC 5404 / NCIMB 10678 / 9a) TaxID=1128398 RepID=K0AYP0_GOTA9|nr:Fe-Mn family superoxide dismutase [Gottschalkia acidurici]AFS78374.1 superoxide dismutase, Fe [Gottschalkia acidurici 9a]